MANDVHKNRNYYIIDFREKINANQSKLMCPKSNIKYKNIPTNSCFDIKKYTNKINFNNINFDITTEKSKDEYKTKIVDMHLSEHQKVILQRWFRACMKMYNVTINHIRQNINVHAIKILKSNLKINTKLKLSITKKRSMLRKENKAT